MNTCFVMRLFAVSLLLLAGTMALQGQQTVYEQRDSLREAIPTLEGKEKLMTYAKLAYSYDRDVYKPEGLDTLFAIYDELIAEAGKIGLPGYQATAMNSKLSALYSAGKLDDLIEHAPAVLDFQIGNELWRNYFFTSDLLSRTYRRKGDYHTALKEAETLFNKAKEIENSAGIGIALYDMSLVYMSQRRFTEAEESFRESIRLLQDSTTYYNILVLAYQQLAHNLIAQKRYDDALMVIAGSEEANRKYEKTMAAPQVAAWIATWRTYVGVYRQTNDADNAQIYINKIDSITHGGVKMYKDQAHVYYIKKQYEQGLKMIDKAIEELPGDLESKNLKFLILSGMGNAERAVKMHDEIIHGLDSIHSIENNAQLDEIKTQYEVDKHIAEKERNRNYFLIALGGCGLLFLLLGVTVYYNRVVTRKNRGLYRRIKEQDRLADELALMRQRYEINNGGTGTPLSGTRQQCELVNRTHEYLLSERNFAREEMSRDLLVSALGTNKNTLTEAVKAVTGSTPMEYIRNLQLEEARRMLDTHYEMTIEAIAFECGFHAPNTFYRLFRKQYDISPTEYRKMSTLAKQDKMDENRDTMD